MKSFQGHQGDVFFQDVTHDSHFLDFMAGGLGGLELVKPDEDGQTTIVKGEATHHHHRAQCTTYEAANMGNFQAFICDANEDVHLEHYHMTKKKPTGEHSVVPWKKAKYLVRTQQQADLEGNLFPVTD
jgi:ureidoglycolate hydrolase